MNSIMRGKIKDKSLGYVTGNNLMEYFLPVMEYHVLERYRTRGTNASSRTA